VQQARFSVCVRISYRSFPRIILACCFSTAMAAFDWHTACKDRTRDQSAGGIQVRDFLVRLLLGAVAILIGFALTSSAQSAQQDESRSTAALQQQESAQQQNAQVPADEPQTQDAHSFTGRVVRENGKLILKDPITKVSYQFDDQSKVRQYIGKQVKVTGKLDLNSNTIHIENIEPLS
jgi:hypothetical protein